MNHILQTAGLVALAALLLPACGGPGAEEDELTGIVVDPPETLDFGTVYECTEAHEEVLITNYGPDDADISLEIHTLLAEGFAVLSNSEDTTLEADDEYPIAIGLGPPEDTAEEKSATLLIYAPDRSIQIHVIAEVIVGDECP